MLTSTAESIQVRRLGRLFFAFPRGFAGVALLLLRAVSGLAILAEGWRYIAGENPGPGTWFMGLLALAAGAMLLAGFLTPVVAAVVVIGAACVVCSLLPACGDGPFDSRTAGIFGLTMLVAIIGLGPGAFSADARVFGRREIIIPPPILQL
jgi:uncharacterized membrane protein YphA (DoxX/SURF4 family)